MPRLQRHAYAAGRGAQRLQRNSRRCQLSPVGRVDVAVPEVLAEAKTFGEGKHDGGLRSRFASGVNECRAELDARLSVETDVEAEPQRFALERRGDGQDH